jgi:SAM-dependent methyltransferase
MGDHKEAFTKVYEECHWGDNKEKGYKGSSGEGSSIEYNLATYIPFIRAFFKIKGIKSVVDVGCGDWRCGDLIYRQDPIDYTGVDAYEALIKRNSEQWSQHKWMCMDGFKERASLPSADLLILKDVLQHWTTAEIYEFLDDITTSKKFKYILIVNCSFQKADDEDIPEHIINTYRHRPLSANFFPLKKYGAKILTKYKTKEACLIETS